MRLGVVILPDDAWHLARSRWERADELGLDHAWTYDHLTWRHLQNEPWFAAVPTLAAAALCTRSIRLGTLVASPNFRHPVPFAKELMSLDDLSRGRLTLGLGAGGTGFDSSALGQEPWSPSERADRFEEFTVFLDTLLSNPATNREGRFYNAREARAIPGCTQKPRLPFAIAATGPRGMRLAARFAETWVTLDPREAGPEQVERLEIACQEFGRDPSNLRRLALLGSRERPLESLGAFQEIAGRHEAMGFTDLVVHYPGAKAELDVLEEVAGRQTIV